MVILQIRCIFAGELILCLTKKRTIMKKCFVMVAAIGSMVAWSGCSEQVMNEDMRVEVPQGQSLLRVQTRSATPPQEGQVYVFNSLGDCVRLLSTDESGQLASTNLVAGDYTVCAIGGEDLSAYTLPDQDVASVSSVITLAEGEEMSDLFMTSSDVTLTEGNASNLELELERQVIMIKEVSIKQVPTDVTKVEVSISPLHEGIQLDGTFTEDHTSLTLDLTKSSDNKTWTNGENQPYGFPSAGNPTITISFTLSNGVKTYSYQASEPFAANHQVVLEGTYSEAQDAILSGTLIAKAWEADKSESFEFNEDNLVENTTTEPEEPEEPAVPVAGGTFLGYYVVSVNSSDRTAVLLRRTQENNVYSESIMAQKAAAINKPEGVTCGEWRLPTVEECRIFLEDPIVNEKKYGSNYYCLDGTNLKMMRALISSEGVITIKGPIDCSYNDLTYYRPVIDITY